MRFKSKIIYLFFINIFLWPLILTAQERTPGDVGIIPPTLAENQRPNFKIENGFGWALFCEGDVDNPCGFVEYTFSPVPPAPAPILTPSFIELALDTRVCKGNNCQCDFVNRTPCVCQNTSCITALNAVYTLNPIPEKNDLFRAEENAEFKDGLPFSATMTKHTPIDCEDHTTGDFLTECVAARAQGRIPKLDYRCQVIAIFNEDNTFVDLSRSLAGTFIIKINEP